MMVWGAIAHGQKGPLIWLDMLLEETGEAENSKKKKGRGMNGSKYVIQVLRGPLKSFVEELEGERGHGMLVVEDGNTHAPTLDAKTDNNRLYNRPYRFALPTDLSRYRYRRAPMYLRSFHTTDLTNTK